MPEVVTFVGYQPPLRFDAIPWTEARIEEAATETGTYTQIDVVALAPLDADPAAPAFRNFTTENGATLGYWYQVLFADADGDTSQPTIPVQNVAGVDDPATVYGTVDELFRRLKIRTPTVEQTAAADRIMVASSTEVNLKMGLTAAPTEGVLAIATEAAYQRAEERWNESEVPFGAIGLDNPSGPVFASRNSRALAQLTKVQESWGVG